jgi:hypothetical protein
MRRPMRWRYSPSAEIPEILGFRCNPTSARGDALFAIGIDASRRKSP